MHRLFDLIVGLTKELIKLSTGVITVALLFSEKIPQEARKAAFWSWTAFVLSTFFGVLALMAVTGAHEKAAESASEPQLRFNLKFFSGAQVVMFATGVIGVWILGFKLLT